MNEITLESVALLIRMRVPGINCTICPVPQGVDSADIIDNILIHRKDGSTYQLLAPVELRELRDGKLTSSDVNRLIATVRRLDTILA